MLRLSILTALIVAGWWCDASAQKPITADLEPVRLVPAQPPLVDDGGTPANDISGIACTTTTGPRRTCLVINDEDQAAQFVTLDGDRMIGGRKVRLIGDKPSDKTVGKAPEQVACSDGRGKFKDLDGEGVAFDRSFFYVSGSHSCSRHSNKFRLSSFIVARVRVDGEGRVLARDGAVASSTAAPDDYVETTYRLSEALATAPRVGSFFTKDLNETVNGLNIEGIAVAGGKLFAGLRAPVFGRESFLISVDVDKLFARDRPLTAQDVGLTALPLGEHAGTRDLAAIDGGRMLVLSGPAQQQADVPYGVFLVDLGSPEKPTFLATFKPVIDNDVRAKAEAVHVLQALPDALDILVLYDSVPGGGARVYRVPLR
ncbi:MAG: DUF3616 domain-containing protein [Reyranellaceae bacterium]